METLKERLINIAQAKGICDEGYRRMLEAAGVDGLIGYYIGNPDWCMERDFPPIEMLRADFGGIEDRGVYVGKRFDGEVMRDKQVYIFHGCTGMIEVEMNYERGIIPMLYFANKCKMRVKCHQDNGRNPIRVPLYQYGKNDVQAKDCAGASFVRYKHGLI